jgi:choice-of-anchor A domain-containing protein
MRFVAKGLLGFAGAMVLVAMPAHAVTQIDTKAQAALTAMQSLNVIVLGNYNNSGNGDIEGKAWVGGNATGNKLQVGFGNSSQSAGQSSYKTLTVVGNMANGADLYNGTVANGTVGTYNSSATGSYGLKVGGNMTDGDHGVDTKANNGVITIGGYVNRLTLDGSGQTVTVNGALGSSFTENASNTTVRAQSYGGNINNIGSGSNVYISGSINNQNNVAGWHGNVSQTLNAPTTSSMASDVSTMAANMKDLSVHLSSLGSTNTMQMIGAGGNSTVYDMLFNITNTTNGYAVFNVSAAQLFSSNARGIGFELNGQSISGLNIPIVINITGLANGTNYNLNLGAGVYGYGNAIYDSSLASDIIWNLGGYTGTLTTSSQIEGSVLTPYGTLDTTNGQNIEGSVVASVFSQGGEVHLGTLDASDSSGANIVKLATVSAVPETSAWNMMIVGFGLVGSVIRRRKPRHLPIFA